MASKRSQVRSNLQTITANQPVARVIDTYAPSASPAPRKTDTTDILKTLINFGQSQGKRIAAQKKAEQEALEQQEKDAVELAFLEDPDQFNLDIALFHRALGEGRWEKRSPTPFTSMFASADELQSD